MDGPFGNRLVEECGSSLLEGKKGVQFFRTKETCILRTRLILGSGTGDREPFVRREENDCSSLSGNGLLITGRVGRSAPKARGGTWWPLRDEEGKRTVSQEGHEYKAPRGEKKEESHRSKGEKRVSKKTAGG